MKGSWAQTWEKELCWLSVFEASYSPNQHLTSTVLQRGVRLLWHSTLMSFQLLRVFTVRFQTFEMRVQPKKDILDRKQWRVQTLPKILHITDESTLYAEQTGWRFHTFLYFIFLALVVQNTLCGQNEKKKTNSVGLINLCFDFFFQAHGETQGASWFRNPSFLCEIDHVSHYPHSVPQ